jgi:hypothetical protein
VSTLQIEVSKEIERGLQEEAARRGQSVEHVAAAALEERFALPIAGAGIPEQVKSLFEGLPRRSPADLLALAEAQGVRPVERFEDRAPSGHGDFWPEDESCDEFITWLREGRQDGRGESRR